MDFTATPLINVTFGVITNLDMLCLIQPLTTFYYQLRKKLQLGTTRRSIYSNETNMLIWFIINLVILLHGVPQVSTQNQLKGKYIFYYNLKTIISNFIFKGHVLLGVYSCNLNRK